MFTIGSPYAPQSAPVITNAPLDIGNVMPLPASAYPRGLTWLRAFMRPDMTRGNYRPLIMGNAPIGANGLPFNPV